MRLTAWVWRNLNAPEWNRRVWEIGYRGPPLPKQKMYAFIKYNFFSPRIGYEIREMI